MKSLPLPFTRVILVCLTLFIAGCEKDEIFLIDSPTKVLSSEAIRSFQDSIVIQTALAPEGSKEAAYRYFSDGLAKSKDGEEHLRAVLDTIMRNPAERLALRDSTFSVYSYYVPVGSTEQFANLVVKFDRGTVTAGYFTVYTMEPEFAQRFNAGQLPIEAFQGTVRNLTVKGFLKAYGIIVGGKTVEDCFKVAFDGPSGGSSGGGGSSGSGDEGPSGSNDGQPVGGSSHTGTISISGISVGGSGTSTGGTGGSGGSGGGGDLPGANTGVCSEHTIEESETRTVIVRTYCDGTRETIYVQKKAIIVNNDEAPRPTLEPTMTAKNYEDCVKLLEMAAIVPRSLNYQTVDERLEDKVALAIASTPFDIRAVLSILDPAAFEDCYAQRGTDATCVSDQVAEYLDDLVDDRVESGVLRRSFRGLAYPILARFLHFALATGGSDNATDVLAYAGLRLSTLTDEAEILDEQLGHLLALRNRAEHKEDFERAAETYLQVVDNAFDEFSHEDFKFMVDNIGQFTEVASFAEQYGSFNTQYVVRLYREYGFDFIPFSGTKDRYLTFYYPFTDDYVPEAPTPVIDNGIEIVHVTESDWDIENNLQLQTTSFPPRGNTEDLRMDQSLEGVNGQGWPELRCKGEFELLAFACTVSATTDADLAVDEYIERFYQNSSADYSNANLHAAVKNTPEWKNAVKLLGERVRDQLMERCNADPASCSLISTVTKLQDLSLLSRPKFEQNTYAAKGLTFLINDTEATYFSVPRVSVNPQRGTWNATVHMQLIDHFGLDYNDVIKYQDTRKVYKIGNGFAGWYLLQNKFGYAPFRTVLQYRIELSGEL